MLLNLSTLWTLPGESCNPTQRKPRVRSHEEVSLEILRGSATARLFSPDMKGKWKKIIVGVLMIVIGLPAAFILTAFACSWIMDKINGTIVSSGVTRRYLLYVPKTYDRTKATPLVISLHPAATWPAVEMNISRWNDVAEEHGFLVVYPEGTGAFFGGLGRGPQIWPMGPHSLERDVRFISDLIDKLEAEYNIDANRIYADGMSNGGGMAFALSCRLSDRVAAVGAVAAAQAFLPVDRCRDSKPVATVAFHGTADKFAPTRAGHRRSPPASFRTFGIGQPAWRDETYVKEIRSTLKSLRASAVSLIRTAPRMQT